MERRIRELRQRRQDDGGDRTRSSGPGSARRRRISRREREARRRRLLIMSMSIVGGIVLLILSGFALYEYQFKPNTVLASVNGEDIRRRDYWKYRSVELFDQARQYQDFAGFTQGDQQLQFLQLAAQLEAQRSDVWGSTDLNESTLNQMIDDKLYLQQHDDLNLAISDQDLDRFILSQFDPPDAELVSPIPSPTLIPTRAAWATGTAETLATENAAFSTTSEALPAIGGSPVASPRAAGSPQVLSPRASPFASPGGFPISGASPTAPATPNPDEAVATAEAGFQLYQDRVFAGANLSREDYERLIARPRLARQMVDAELTAAIGQTAEQVRGSHILVATRELAEQLHTRLQEDTTEFAALAREQSIDTATAANGGELGWFTREDVPEPLAAIAFATEPGRIGELIETDFGWHVVLVAERAADRPLTDAQIQTLRQATIEDWLVDQRAAAEIESDLDPTPTPPPGQFEPPPNAPPAPTPTAIPTIAVASPIASPIFGPLVPPATTPTS
ncbi:MAG: peptidylprolyl isomerase [Chloroflexota bacterium]|nr:peptidylprolyl isomerase [Chloroflexota bacterium]